MTAQILILTVTSRSKLNFAYIYDCQMYLFFTLAIFAPGSWNLQICVLLQCKNQNKKRKNYLKKNKNC